MNETPISLVPTMMLPFGRVVHFDPEHFRAWLHTYAPTETVGLTQAEHCCPLASWLRETYHEWFCLCLSLVSVDRPSNQPEGQWRTVAYHYTVPEWCQHFMYQVDQRSAAEHGDMVPVTAQQALTLLDEALTWLTEAERRYQCFLTK